MKRLPGPHNGIFTNFQALQEFIGAQIKSHKLALDPSEPRDYIDAFLVESNVRRREFQEGDAPDFVFSGFSQQNEANGELGFTEENLVLCCMDLFLAGTETSSKTLQWGLIFLIQNPQIMGGFLLKDVLANSVLNWQIFSECGNSSLHHHVNIFPSFPKIKSRRRSSE